MPTLFVIAGPNGAGKSSLSTVLLPEGVSSFDGDKQLQELKAKYPDTDDAHLLFHVNDVLFPRAKQDAIKAGSDFAYETNFATEDVMNTVNEFRVKGYETELIYIGLPSVEQAMARVRLRMEQGGHAVTREDILSNYKEGLENTAKHIEKFDKASILENAAKLKVSLPRKLAKYQNGKLVQQLKDPPEWARKIIGKKDFFLSKKRKGKSKGRGL